MSAQKKPKKKSEAQKKKDRDWNKFLKALDKLADIRSSFNEM